MLWKNRVWRWKRSNRKRDPDLNNKISKKKKKKKTKQKKKKKKKKKKKEKKKITIPKFNSYN